MGNKICLVINNSDRDITIKECKKMYCEASRKRENCPTGETKNLGPTEHARYSPSKLRNKWRRRQKIHMSSEIRVSFEGQNSNGVMLLLDDFERNVGIVFNVRGNQLVKESVSRTEANMISERDEERLKERLIFIVENRNTASTSPSQQRKGRLYMMLLRGIACISAFPAVCAVLTDQI